jgi:hypothetical protein
MVGPLHAHRHIGTAPLGADLTAAWHERLHRHADRFALAAVLAGHRVEHVARAAESAIHELVVGVAVELQDPERLRTCDLPRQVRTRVLFAARQLAAVDVRQQTLRPGSIACGGVVLGRAVHGRVVLGGPRRSHHAS